jgi:hypothetical protein
MKTDTTFSSAAVWSRLGLAHVANLDDVDVWNAEVPATMDARLWPFILQTILWRLWDARNGEIFRQESPHPAPSSPKYAMTL